MEENDVSQESAVPAENMATIKEVFLECQETNKSENFVLVLEKLYEESDETEFFKEFCSLLLHVLVHVGAETPVNRISKVVINFLLRLDKEYSKAMEEDEEEDLGLHPFVENMLNFLLEMEDAACYSVRLRALHLMSILFKELNELPSGGAFWDSLSDMASSRLRDTSASVRAKAVLTFCYLQDPSSPSCPVIADFLLLMGRDPNHIVRRNITNSIAVTSKTLIPLKSRLQDVNSSVRKTALIRISEKVSINCFTVVQRMEILTICVNDSSHEVRLTAKQRLLPAWLKMCDNDVMKFLDLVDIQSIPDVMQKVLNLIFEIRDVRNIAKAVGINPESYLMSAEELTVPQAFLWRCLCQYVKTMKASYAVDFFDDLTPTLSNLCAYLEEYFRTMNTSKDKEDIINHCFTFQQILCIASELDFSDIFGEQTLHALILEILKSNMCLLEMVKPLVLCLKCIKVNHQKFLEEIYDIAQEIHRPLMVDDIDLKNAANFITMRKVLTILIEAWKFPVFNQAALDVDEIKDNLIMPVLTHENHHVRRTAVEALGLYSMYSVEEARSNYSRFMEAIIYGQLDVQIMALKVAFDIIIIFGYRLISELETVKASESALEFPDPNSEKRQLILFVEKLMPLLDSEAPEMVHVAVEGLAKVMICQRITSSMLFFKLCTMRYDAVNEDDEKLIVYVDTFMPAYAESKALTTNCLKETFSKALELTIDAPARTELSRVDGISFLKTLIQLAHLIPTTTHLNISSIIVHNDLALMLCEKILEDPEADSVPSLIKLFNNFTITHPVPDELIDAVGVVQNKIESKKLLVIINNFLLKLSDPKSDDDEEEIPLSPRQLSFSQISLENLSETGTTTNVPSSQDTNNDSQPSLKIFVDDSSSFCEADIESDSDFEKSPLAKMRSVPDEVDMSDELIIPESPEYEQGNGCFSISVEDLLEKNDKLVNREKTSYESDEMKSASKSMEYEWEENHEPDSLQCAQRQSSKSQLIDSDLEKSHVSESEESDENIELDSAQHKLVKSSKRASIKMQLKKSCGSELEESYISESSEEIELARSCESDSHNQSRGPELLKKELQLQSSVKKGYGGKEKHEKSCDDDDVFLCGNMKT